MNVILTGKVIAIFDSQISGNFEKRIMWLEELMSPQYPQTWALEFHQGNCNLLDAYKEGDLVDVKVNIAGRTFDKKDGSGKTVINTLKGFSVRVFDPNNHVRQPLPKPPQPLPPATANTQQYYPQQQQSVPQNWQNDDLPF